MGLVCSDTERDFFTVDALDIEVFFFTNPNDRHVLKYATVRIHFSEFSILDSDIFVFLMSSLHVVSFASNQEFELVFTKFFTARWYSVDVFFCFFLLFENIQKIAERIRFY